MVASMFRMVSAQPDPGAVLATWDEVATAMRVIPEDRVNDDDAIAKVFAFTSFPPRRTGRNLVNKPTGTDQQGDQTPLPCRRDLPQPAAVNRLVGAVLAHIDDEWEACEQTVLQPKSVKPCCG